MKKGMRRGFYSAVELGGNDHLSGNGKRWIHSNLYYRFRSAWLVLPNLNIQNIAKLRNSIADIGTTSELGLYRNTL